MRFQPANSNDEPPIDLETVPKRIASAIQFWQEYTHDGFLPDRAAFDALNLRPWLGHISIYVRVDGGSDFLVRLEGTEISQMTSENRSGRRLSAMDAEYGSNLISHLHYVARARRPKVDRVRIFQRHVLTATRAFLPVATDRRNCDQVFLVMYADPVAD